MHKQTHPTRAHDYLLFPQCGYGSVCHPSFTLITVSWNRAIHFPFTFTIFGDALDTFDSSTQTSSEIGLLCAPPSLTSYLLQRSDQDFLGKFLEFNRLEKIQKRSYIGINLLSPPNLSMLAAYSNRVGAKPSNVRHPNLIKSLGMNLALHSHRPPLASTPTCQVEHS